MTIMKAVNTRNVTRIHGPNGGGKRTYVVYVVSRNKKVRFVFDKLQWNQSRMQRGSQSDRMVLAVFLTVTPFQIR